MARPWGDASGHALDAVAVWLLKLGVDVHATRRPYHPQSRGKNERFHRTLKAEVFALARFHHLAQVQRAFDLWREVYNFERPHDALDLGVPARRYRLSNRAMPRKLPGVEYDSHEIVRTVPQIQRLHQLQGTALESSRKPSAANASPSGPKTADGKYGIFFASYQIATIDLTKPKSVGHVSEQVSVYVPGLNNKPGHDEQDVDHPEARRGWPERARP